MCVVRLSGTYSCSLLIKSLRCKSQHGADLRNSRSWTRYSSATSSRVAPFCGPMSPASALSRSCAPPSAAAFAARSRCALSTAVSTRRDACRRRCAAEIAARCSSDLPFALRLADILAATACIAAQGVAAGDRVRGIHGAAALDTVPRAAGRSVYSTSGRAQCVRLLLPKTTRQRRLNLTFSDHAIVVIKGCRALHTTLVLH